MDLFGGGRKRRCASTAILDAIHRIVNAECEASGGPQPPEFELFDHVPATESDQDVTEKVAAAFRRQFGEHAQEIPVNHSSTFAPVLQPTVDTGTIALVVAALAWLAAPLPPGST